MNRNVEADEKKSGQTNLQMEWCGDVLIRCVSSFGENAGATINCVGMAKRQPRMHVLDGRRNL